MSIGEELLAARHRAGLTVSDVSGSTRIREVIIRGIERDDFAACGGDFYARGHVRAIAHAVGADPRPLIEEYDATRRSQEIAAAAVFAPATPIKLRERRGVNWTAVLSVLVLAALGFAGYSFLSGPGHAARAGVQHPRQHPARRPGSTPSRRPGVGAAAPDRLLTPAGASAFGPAGIGSGDDPADAALAIDTIAGTAWHTSWYASADFGGLQPGTGLLIDLGKPVPISSVLLTLGQVRGADVQVRAGDSPVLADLLPVASETGAGSVVRLRLAVPVTARYALIWFTKLPPDQAGSFQAAVYDVRIYGGQPGSADGQLAS